MANNRVALIRFVLARADDAPVSQRIPVYRGLADICGDEKEAKELSAIAADLESTQSRCRQFAFEFNQKEES